MFRCAGTEERREILEAAPMSKLFSSGKLGPYALSHRVVFAPMTRLRSDTLDTPLPKVETQLVRAWLARIIAKHFVQ